MDINTLKAVIRAHILGKDIVHFKEIASTNDSVRTIAEKGAPEGLVIVADVQTGGKGRAGRRWESPPGGLWFSFLLRPKMPPGAAPAMTLAVGSAVAKSLRSLYKVDARVKWPNDVLIGGKKVCGILAEASAQGGTLDFVVVGVGINANNPAAELKLENPIAPPISLKELIGKDVDTTALLVAILEEMERAYKLMTEAGAQPLLEDWSALSDTIGRKVEVADGGERVVGTARRITADGALVVESANGEITFHSGDCKYL